MTTLGTKEKRTAADVLREIETKLASVDGIATADAFTLGGLVREYGEVRAGEVGISIMGPILDAMSKPRKDEPWK